MGFQETSNEIESLSADVRKRLAAFLVSLRHKELAEYRHWMAQKIGGKNAENRTSLEELDQRLES